MISFYNPGNSLEERAGGIPEVKGKENQYQINQKILILRSLHFYIEQGQ